MWPITAQAIRKAKKKRWWWSNIILLMFDQLPEGKDFLEVNSSRPLLPPRTFIPRTDNKADEMLPVLLCCPLLAASTTSNTSSPSPPKMKPHSFTLIAFCFGHAQTPPRHPPHPPPTLHIFSTVHFNLGLSALRNSKVISSWNGTCKCAAESPYSHWVLPGVRFLRLGSVEAARD